MTLLANQLDSLGKQVRAIPSDRQDWAALRDEVEDAVAVSLTLFSRLGKLAAKSGGDEAEARSLVPLYRQWNEFGQVVLELIRHLKSNSLPVEGTSEFMHALSQSKAYGFDFDSLRQAMASRG